VSLSGFWLKFIDLMVKEVDDDAESVAMVVLRHVVKIVIIPIGAIAAEIKACPTAVITRALVSAMGEKAFIF
jgi:hypothetical protein